MPNYITPQGLSALKSELKQLIHDERPKLVKTVAWAASNGDRSENADYIYGKRRLREIDKRAGILTKKIEDAEVVDPSQQKSDKVIFGATVTLLDEDEDEKTFQIVGLDEVDAANGKVSWQSPVAKALLGKKVGDEAVIKRPSGDLIVEIISIEFR
jgi:transcription elongation factor GreB